MSLNTNLEGYNIVRNFWQYFYNPSKGTFIAPQKCSGCYDNEKFNVWSVSVAVQAVVDGARIYPNELGPLIDPAVQTFQRYKNNSVKGYCAAENGGDNRDIYYDDDAQVASAIITAYEVTGNKKYLDSGRELVRFLMGGWNDDPNAVTKGGVLWHMSKTYVNACTTAEVAKACLQIAKFIPNEQQTYIQFAANCIDWQMNNLLDPDDGTILDGVGKDSHNIDRAKWTYNMGTTLSAASHLYHFTKDDKWKHIASNLAKVSINRNSPFYDRDYPDDKRYWRDSSYFVQLLIEGLADYLLVFGSEISREEYESIQNEVGRHLVLFYEYSRDPKDGLYIQSFEPHRGTDESFSKYKREFGGHKNHDPKDEDKAGKCLIGVGAAARVFFQGARVCPTV